MLVAAAALRPSRWFSRIVFFQVFMAVQAAISSEDFGGWIVFLFELN
jgi:hypothetical protein